MVKLNRVQKSKSKPWIAVGIALSIMIIGVGGCGTTTEATSKSTNTNETAQGQTSQKPTLNPAMQAAMEIRRLQSNQEMVLTSDQKDKIKPIIQLLIDTTSPSQDFLQQKADAINAVFTEQQKTYLKSQTQKGDPNANPNGNPSGDKQKNPSFQPQDIYKQLLSSLT